MNQSIFNINFVCRLVGLMVATAIAQPVVSARQTAYYVSSSSGSDYNAGTQSEPWKSLNKPSTFTLQPGDTLFFKRGELFLGQYVVNGSGTTTNPIVITAYGEGEKPILSGQVGAAGGGDYEEAVKIENVDNLVFDGIEVQNERKITRTGIDDYLAYGILIRNNGKKPMMNLKFKNITVKNVFAVQAMLSSSDFDKIQVAGMCFTTGKNTLAGSEKNINGVEVTNSLFANCQRFGIQFKHNGGADGIGNDSINRNMNIHIHDNMFYYNGGTGVLPNGTYNCLIENNYFDHPGASTDPRMPGRGSSIWNINSINTIMQYNMCIGNRGYLDSHGIHIDNFNKNTFVQYNFMDSTEGGFVEILRGNKIAVYRFNMSLNEGFRVKSGDFESNHTIWVNAVRHKPADFALSDSIFIYNNTVVLNKPFEKQTYTCVTMDASNAYVYNNIFSSVNGGATIAGYLAIQKAAGTSYTFTNNLFQGNVNPDFVILDKAPVKGNPLFAGTGQKKYAFQLMNGSPAINAGLANQGPRVVNAGYGVFKNIPEYPNVDLYGNPIDLKSGTPNIGACNAKFGEVVDKIKPVKAEYSWIVNYTPKSSVLKLSNDVPITGAIEFSLVNLKGQTVQNGAIAHKSTGESISINLNSTVTSGIYFLNISSNGQNHCRRIGLYR